MKIRKTCRPLRIIDYKRLKNMSALRRNPSSESTRNTVGKSREAQPDVTSISEKKFLIFDRYRHDDRSRRPATKKSNRRRHDQHTKRPYDDSSKLTNSINVDYESPDCIVSEWNEWSACSKSCGLGEKFRNRTIVKTAKRNGMPCPQLTERSWCGSSRCKPSLINENIDNSSYFKW
jgi:Spondin-like TSP1 domain